MRRQENHMEEMHEPRKLTTRNITKQSIWNETQKLMCTPSNQQNKMELEEEEQEEIKQAADKLKWGHQKGVYTVKEGYQQLCSRNPVIDNWPRKLIWRTKLPPKVVFSPGQLYMRHVSPKTT
ncbi:hypothetical protein H5410_042684 [Solanum commersonii]|uniref:Uncharacterized protein n=1 Tax=Solanum commersonii TaxID=4109 RepID=A0A9J5XWQ1_SOLCO|nr:hypothetical protein H5410_042684 [Solanum commersonii]